MSSFLFLVLTCGSKPSQGSLCHWSRPCHWAPCIQGRGTALYTNMRPLSANEISEKCHISANLLKMAGLENSTRNNIRLL
uniref:Uncharacterized protein n=1 Tax=Anguilla anguilla TaxID=7936 RepID=A0A0E9RH47_ANGAN